MTKEESIQFGRPLRAKYFDQVPEDILLVNNGAHGLAPRRLIDAAHKNFLRDYAWPDNYRRNIHKVDYEESAKEIGRIVNTDHTNIALGTNVTTLINAVLRSWKWNKGDTILITNNTYPAIRKTISFVASQFDLKIVEIELNYPLSDDEVVEIYKNAYETNNITLSLLDAVSSKPGVRLPFERLIKLSSEYNVLSLVDAAHGIGLLDLDLDELKPDFFTSDLYKWYYTPRGSSFLYVNPKHHKSIHSLPISHFYTPADSVLAEAQEKTRVYDQFSYTGANIYGHLFTVKEASDFIEEIGGLQKVKDWNFQLARDVGDTVSKLWGTSVLDNKEGTLITSLVSVEFPTHKDAIVREKDWETFELYKLIRGEIESKLISEERTTAPIFYHNGKVYIRFSAQIYSELDDYVAAAKKIEKTVNEFLLSDAYKALIKV